ncbi:MAG: alpha/beta fold hydrolase [Bacteroidetes bacterium]|nr:alpha/beta fold hydrolase [Bacteroidota bacterium]
MKKAKLSVAVIFALFALLVSSCEKEKNLEADGNLVPKTVDQDPSLPSINVNGAKLHAQAFGPMDSTLIICIHGGPGANFKYLLNCKSLADKGYRVVFYDQRGSGLSERFNKEWYLSLGENAIEETFYKELKGIITHYKTHPSQKVVLLTQSWGSILATGYVGKFPNDVQGLILAEPGGLKWADIVEYVGASRSFKLWSEALNDVTYLDQFITGKENQHNILDYKMALISTSNAIVGDIKSNLGTNGRYYNSVRDGAVISAAMFEIGKKYKPDFSQGISQFNKKVLFFYSSNNQAYPDSWAEKISSVYLNKEVVKVNGVGHSGMFDQIDTWVNFTEPKVIEYLHSL